MTTIITVIVAVLIATVGVRQLQRAAFYPRPSRFPDTVTDDTDLLIQRFEAALVVHAPDVLAALQPGLSEADIVGIEQEFGFRLTDELRKLYRWRNGSLPEEQTNFVPGHLFRSLGRAAQERAELKRQLSSVPFVQRVLHFIFVGHRTGWLHVLDDLCGDGYFFDPAARRRPGNFFYHFAENRQYRFFLSLNGFLAGAVECYESGIYRSGREDYERSFLLWEQYSARPGT